ncbi:hypothetical protein [Flavobacterium daemonense]|uniref:hypothetical protein n=1 Tax=Flavobacterium daemonense TaxID=1393049 RepID=UPI001184C096|nr:hypothetical protein [Flavobacterium daemonense]KAF2332487.1 hypothetical protein FND99_11895 [Flavobacterium daemonense]
MKKLFLFFLFLESAMICAQTKNRNLFYADSTITSFSFVKVQPPSFMEYKNVLYSSQVYSIYNPKPGFLPINTKSQHYYSLANTNKLLKLEMSSIKPTPIFPDEDNNKSLRDAIFETVVSSIFE